MTAKGLELTMVKILWLVNEGRSMTVHKCIEEFEGAAVEGRKAVEGRQRRGMLSESAWRTRSSLYKSACC